MTRLDDFLHALRKDVRGELRTDTMSRILYGTDASLYQVMPHGVLFPTHDEDVQASVTLAAKYGVPVLARTAGTSLAGQAVNEALILDFTRHLDGILDVDPEARRVRVQPGVVLDDLNRALAVHGLQFGPDPASGNRAALGGIVGNNATGSHSILHGMTADHVEEVEVILADGSRARFAAVDESDLAGRTRQNDREGAIYREVSAIARDHRDTILRHTPRHWRRSGGYNLDRLVEGARFHRPRTPRFNLAELVCGSEGTLAVMTTITLGLVPRPACTGLAVIHGTDLVTTLAWVPTVLETGPSAVEFMDQTGLRLTRQVPAFARLLETFVTGQPDCILVAEYQGATQAEVEARVTHLADHLRRARIPGQVVPVLDARRQAHVWTVRKAGLGLMMSMKGDRKPVPFIEDAAVPVEHLPDYVTSIEAFCRERDIRVAYYAHASAGCLHIRPVINTRSARELARMPEITGFAVELLRRFGGCLSSEHGDGRSRSGFNERFFGPDLYALFRRVKAAFDPDGVLNPGMVVEAQPMTENLRAYPDQRELAIPEQTEFAEHGGWLRAVEMCNGAGICRQRHQGAMCPSFQATRDEEHSTRGRANALRAVLTGRLPPEALSDRRLFQVMDLCVECKACRTECPSSVDMARIKTEFLAHYYRYRPVPLRARLFGHIHGLSRLSSGWRAPLVNRLLRVPVVRRLLEQTVGISRHRTLPRFARRPFPAGWSPTNRPARNDPGEERRAPDRAEVVLYLDTFHTYHEPAVARAAAEILDRAGYRVELCAAGGSGRPLLSKGLVNPARRAARRILDALHPFAARGVPVIGLEPSCLLTIRDDYAHLLPDDARVAEVAGRAVLFEEFVVAEAEAGTLELRFDETPRKILVHAHCHEKALASRGSLARMLSLPPGHEVSEIDAGCCGMAGAFGYEAEHLAVSLAMAEDRLFPAIRAADPDTLIAAPGISCRQQIRHGTDREPLHPVQILREAIVD